MAEGREIVTVAGLRCFRAPAAAEIPYGSPVAEVLGGKAVAVTADLEAMAGAARRGGAGAEGYVRGEIVTVLLDGGIRAALAADAKSPIKGDHGEALWLLAREPLYLQLRDGRIVG